MKGLSATTWYAIAFTLLTAAGTIVTVVRQARESDADKASLLKELNDIKDERKNLRTELLDRDKKIDKKNDKIIDLNNKITEKSDYISNYLTGGDAFPIIEPRPLLKENGSLSGLGFFLSNTSKKWPVYDVYVELYNYYNIQAKEYLSSDGNRKLVNRADVESSRITFLRQSLLYPDYSGPIEGSITNYNHTYWAIIGSRNSFNYEKLACVKVGDHIYFGLIIYNQNNKILLERIEGPQEAKQELKAKLESIPSKPMPFNMIN